MKTRIKIDDVLMGEAMAVSATSSKKETIELALKKLIKKKKRSERQIFSNKVTWYGNKELNTVDWYE